MLKGFHSAFVLFLCLWASAVEAQVLVAVQQAVAPPTFTTTPTVIGTLTEGSALSADYDFQTVGGYSKFESFIWTRADDASGMNASVIAGETKIKYVTIAGDNFIKVRVTGVNTVTETSLDSPYVGPITPDATAPVFTTDAYLTGSVVIGNTSTVQYTVNQADSFTYEWFRDADGQGAGTPITGPAQTSQSYTVGDGNLVLGEYFYSVVTATNPAGSTTSQSPYSQQTIVAGTPAFPSGYSSFISRFNQSWVLRASYMNYRLKGKHQGANGTLILTPRDPTGWSTDSVINKQVGNESDIHPDGSSTYPTGYISSNTSLSATTVLNSHGGKNYWDDGDRFAIPSFKSGFAQCEREAHKCWQEAIKHFTVNPGLLNGTLEDLRVAEQTFLLWWRDEYSGNGGVPGIFNYTDGFAADYVNNGSVKSQTAVIKLATASSYAQDYILIRQSLFTTVREREVAYVALAYINAEVYCEQPHRTKLPNLIGLILADKGETVGSGFPDSLGGSVTLPEGGHWEQWLNTYVTDDDTGAFVSGNHKFWRDDTQSPFMIGYQSWTLIKYNDLNTYTGTHSGGTSTTVLTDGGETWEKDIYVGRTLTNTTTGASGVVTSNDAISMTVDSLTGGSRNNWQNSDAYTLVGLINGGANDYDARVIPKLKRMCDAMWILMWGDAVGSMAYRYDQVPSSGVSDLEKPDIANIIFPAYAWLYLKTGKTRFRDRAELLFKNALGQNPGNTTASAGLKNYNWKPPYTITSPKQWNDALRYTFRGLKWYSEGVARWE